MKKKAIFNLFRTHYGLDRDQNEATIGSLYDADNNQICYTLEDVVRAPGIKASKRTAIPATGEELVYKLEIRKSPKYGRVVVIYTHKKDEMYFLEHHGISFSFILFHGGNDAEHTEGCILVASNRNTENGKMVIWGSQKELLVEKVDEQLKQGRECYLRVFNLSQIS